MTSPAQPDPYPNTIAALARLDDGTPGFRAVIQAIMDDADAARAWTVDQDFDLEQRAKV